MKVYKLKDHHSVLHRWLNEEGLGTHDICVILEMTPTTLRNYLRDPMTFKASHLSILSEELEVDYNFIMDIIEQK